MKLGEVYYWETDKAPGHAKRHKYQLYICEPDWAEDHTFLFISSDSFGGDYRITKPPYDFLTKPESFVSCSSIVTYSDDELNEIGDCVGHLSREHLLELHDAIMDSNLMERRHIKRVCEAIRNGLK